jgi:excisionase family DNA binding protein
MSASATLETPVAEWITLPAASRRLAVSMSTVRRLTTAGALSYRRVGGAWPRVRADEIDQLARASTRPAAGPTPS